MCGIQRGYPRNNLLVIQFFDPSSSNFFFFILKTALVSFFFLAAVTNCGNSNRKVNSPKNKVISVAVPIKPKRMCKNNEKSLKSTQQNGVRDEERGKCYGKKQN